MSQRANSLIYLAIAVFLHEISLVREMRWTSLRLLENIYSDLRAVCDAGSWLLLSRRLDMGIYTKPVSPAAFCAAAAPVQRSLITKFKSAAYAETAGRRGLNTPRPSNCCLSGMSWQRPGWFG